MKKIVMSLLLIASFAAYASDQSVYSLQQKGQTALKAKNFDEVKKIILQLRAKGSKQEANALEKLLLKAQGVAIEGDMFIRVRELRAEIDDLQQQLDDTIRRGGANEEQITDLSRRLEEALDRLRTESAASQQRIADLLKTVDLSDETIKGMQQNIVEMMELNQKLERENVRLKLFEENCTKDSADLRKQLEARDPKGAIAELNKQITDLSQEKIRLLELNNNLEDALSKALKTNAERDAQINDLGIEKNKLFWDLHLSKQTLEQLRVAYDSYERKSKKEIKSLNQQIDQLKAGGQGDSAEAVVRIRELEANIELLKNNIKDRDAEINALNQDFAQQAEAIKELKKENESLVESLKNANPDAAEIIKKQQQQIERIQNDLKSANEMIARLTQQLDKK